MCRETFFSTTMSTISDASSQPARSKNPSDFEFTDTTPLSRFVTGTGKMLPRRITGLSAKQQRRITKMIKRSRNMLLMS